MGEVMEATTAELHGGKPAININNCQFTFSNRQYCITLVMDTFKVLSKCEVQTSAFIVYITCHL